MFLIQAPLAVLGGIGLLLSTSNMAGKPEGRRKGSIKSKLAGIDYLGMATLVSENIHYQSIPFSAASS